MASIEKILMVRSLDYAYGNKLVLHNVSLSVRQGQVTALVGRSGCGKSTLLKVIINRIVPQQGRVINPFDSTSMVFQDARLLMWKTTRDNIGWGMKASGIGKRQRRLRVAQLAEEVGLSATDLDKYPYELSGGMKQRVALARALAVEPELLLLDESFNALDIGLKEELYQLLIQEIERRGLAVLLITHDLTEAVRLADNIVVLDGQPGQPVYTYACHQPRSTRHLDFLYRTVGELLTISEVSRAFRMGDERRWPRPADRTDPVS